METVNFRHPNFDRRPGSRTERQLLILDPDPSTCLADPSCALAHSLELNLPVVRLQPRNSRLPDRGVPVPDVVLLRAPPGKIAQELITSCRVRWAHAAILALLCAREERRLEDYSSVLDSVDDFLSCPVNRPELLVRLGRLLATRKEGSRGSGGHAGNEGTALESLVGESDRFMQARDKIRPLARSNATLLICGETGSGKEVIARAIHYQGPRHGKPFIPVNCGALPDHLFENELFGHAKGAFTDASAAEKGLIAEAEGGTLFLDEIDALSPSGQVKLLRFLQNGEYRVVGSPRSLIADVRVIAATNADLAQLTRSRSFREDLYYRLNWLSLSLPPLRDRREDIALLVRHFLNRYAIEQSRAAPTISPAALHKLRGYSWPGNVRELESVITKALVFADDERLDVNDIDLPSPDGDSTGPTRSMREAKNTTIESFERGYLETLLSEHQGNISRAAKAAGKERRAFQRLLRKYSLNPHSSHV